MDHAWYTRDVAEMQAWRRVGAHVWSSAVSALLALAYLAVARVRGVSSLMAAIFSPSEWATRGSLALAFAAMQLPVSLASTALLRPSPAPLHVAAGGVDPWGIFASPGSRERWAGARAPPHLFPQGFTPSRWVSPQVPRPSAAEISRDALLRVALVAAHAASGAASCALLAHAAGSVGPAEAVWTAVRTASKPARYGAALGAVASAHHAAAKIRDANFPALARPRAWRVKRAVAPAFGRGAAVATFAVALASLVAVAASARETLASHGIVSGTARLFAFLIAELTLHAVRFAPAGAFVAASWFAGYACADACIADRYRFQPQSLDDGAASASAPLLASLVAADQPWVQHVAYVDFCHVAEHGGGGRRRLLFEDQAGAAYAPAMAAALAPILATTAAMRAALDAAEKADRGIAAGRRIVAGSNPVGGGVRLRGAAAGGAAVAAVGVGVARRDAERVGQSRTRAPAPAGETAAAAAWDMMADDWGISEDRDAPDRDARDVTAEGFASEGVAYEPVANASRRLIGFGSARSSSARFSPALAHDGSRSSARDASASTSASASASQLRSQMDLPVTTASAEARASLASYGRLACLGARIIAGLTVKARDEGEDAWGHLDGKSPSVGAAFRALLAATHAARECVAAGTGGDARAAGVGARARSAPPRAPKLRGAVAAAEAVADATRAAILAIIASRGADEARRMLDPEARRMLDPSSGSETGAASKGAEDDAVASEADVAAGRKPPEELVALLEGLLKWE